MSIVSGYLQQNISGDINVGVGTWIKLVNNATSTAYVSTAATDPDGFYTINSVLPDIYTFYTGPSATGPWTVTEDTNFIVPYTAGDIIVGPQWDFGGYAWDARTLGAKADGTTDDTAAIQATINKAAIAGNSTIVLIPPTCKISSGPLLLTGAGDITLRGTGMTTNVSRLIRGNAAAMVKLGDGVSAGNDFTGKLTIEKLRLDGAGLNADLVQQDNVTTPPGRLHFEQVWLWNFGTGYGFRDTLNHNIETQDSAWIDVATAFGLKGIMLRNGVWTFANCTWGFLTGSGSVAAEIFPNNKSSFYGCVFTTNVDDVVFGDLTSAAYTDSYLFSGCWFENASDVNFNAASASSNIDLTLESCQIHATSGYHVYWSLPTASTITMRSTTFNGQTPKFNMGPAGNGNVLYSETTRAINRVAVVASPFNSTRLSVGPHLFAPDSFAAAPLASTTYLVQGCKGLWLQITGGTGVAVQLYDRLLTNPTTVGAGTTPLAVYVPAGMGINFGAFSVAPTVTAMVD